MPMISRSQAYTLIVLGRTHIPIYSAFTDRFTLFVLTFKCTTVMGQQSLSTRLNALLDAHKLTQQSIFRLSKLVTTDGNVNNGSVSSSTRSLAAGTEAGQVKQELVSDIHDSLKQQEEDLELLRQEIEEVFESGLGSGGSANRARNSERERERARVAAQAARLGEDLRQYVYLICSSLCPVSLGSRRGNGE